jgi:hypothetical protein
MDCHVVGDYSQGSYRICVWGLERGQAKPGDIFSIPGNRYTVICEVVEDRLCGYDVYLELDRPLERALQAGMPFQLEKHPIMTADLKDTSARIIGDYPRGHKKQIYVESDRCLPFTLENGDEFFVRDSEIYTIKERHWHKHSMLVHDDKNWYDGFIVLDRPLDAPIIHRSTYTIRKPHTVRLTVDGLVHGDRIAVFTENSDGTSKVFLNWCQQENMPSQINTRVPPHTDCTIRIRNEDYLATEGKYRTDDRDGRIAFHRVKEQPYS